MTEQLTCRPPHPDQRPVLKDPTRDAILRSAGAVSFPLLEPSEIASLLETYRSLAPSGEQGIQIDLLREDRTFVASADEALRPTWERHLPELFTEHEPFASCFVAKHADEGSGLFVHRDLAVNDERFHRCFTIWIPLVDVSPELDNGPLQLVPGSEHIDGGAFGFTTPVLLDPYHSWLSQHLSPVTMAAGSALVFDARQLHASAPNRSRGLRLAIACLLGRRSAPTIHVVATGRRHRVVREVDREFFIRHAPQEVADHGVPPHYATVDEYDEEVAPIAEQIRQVLSLDSIPQRCVKLPGDVAALMTDRSRPTFPESHAKLGLPADRRDLDLHAADLSADLSAEAALGSFGSFEVVKGNAERTSGNAGATLSRFIPGLIDLETSLSRGDLVILDPTARCRWSADTASTVCVIEAPAIRAGMISSDAASELAPGVRLSVPPNTAVLLWNDGPGPLVLVIAAAPSSGRHSQRSILDRISERVNRTSGGRRRSPVGRRFPTRTNQDQP